MMHYEASKHKFMMRLDDSAITQSGYYLGVFVAN